MRGFRYIFRRNVLLLLAILVLATGATGQQNKLTLHEAVDLALRQNHAIRARYYAVAAERQKKEIAKASYFPSVTNESNLLHITDLQRVEVPGGAFGAIPGGVNIPPKNIFLTQGTQTFETSGTQLSQPITQLIKIHDANRIAAADLRASEASLAKTSDDIVFQVHQLYYRVLITQTQRQAAELEITSGNENLNENNEQVKNGSLLQVSLVESRAHLLEAKQTLLTYDSQICDLSMELSDLLGLPLDTKPVLDPDISVALDVPPREDSIAKFLNNTEKQR